MKTIVFSCTLTMMLVAGSTAGADPLTWEQVGNLDSLVPNGVRDNPKSGDKTEQEWIASVLGIAAADLSYGKVAGSAGGSWQPVENTGNVFAFDLGSETSWFLVKVGNGGDGTHFLFDNSENDQYATIDFSVFGFDKVEIGKVSHVSAGIEPTPVPELASLMLLGAGLATVAAKLRRRKQQAL